MDQAVGVFGSVFEHLAYIFALVVILQLFFCYTLQAIADKQGVASSWMAWVPLLQLYPMVLSGGSSFQPFLGLMAAGVVALILSAFLGPLGMVLAIGWCIWALVYFAQLCWSTAEKRGLSGWIGLLVMIPLVNFIAYPYIAFHDGPVAPSRLGLALGCLFFVLPAYPEFRKAQQIAQLARHFGPMATAAEQGDEAAMRSSMYEMLKEMQGMEGFGEGGGDPDALSAVLRELSSSMASGDSAASELPNQPAPAVEVPELAPVTPFFDCPDGSRERGARPPQAFERWCERQDAVRGRVRHGGYASWHRNGQIHETGLYRDGQRDGVWTRWYADGGQQTQAEFENGRQHGFQIDWNESGVRLREVRFANGEPVGR